TETGQYPEQLTEEIHAFGAGEEVRDALHQLTDHAQNRLAAGVGRRPDSPEDVDNRADDRAQLLEDSDGALDPADGVTRSRRRRQELRELADEVGQARAELFPAERCVDGDADFQECLE